MYVINNDLDQFSNYKFATIIHIFMSKMSYPLPDPYRDQQARSADPTESRSRSRSDRFLTILVRRKSTLKSLKKRNYRDERKYGVEGDKTR
jgi:hypothetical protein